VPVFAFSLTHSIPQKSSQDHTVWMMRVIPFVCYSVTNIDGRPEIRRGAIMGRGWEYQVRVEGRIGQRWLAWFDGLAICAADEGAEQAGGSPATTTLTGVMPDQAALAGLLQKLYTLGLPLVEVRRKEAARVDNLARE
jgi:hypothetical protein